MIAIQDFKSLLCSFVERIMGGYSSYIYAEIVDFLQSKDKILF